MVMCWVPDCKHYSEKNDCKFYRFPKDKKLAEKWLVLVRRSDSTPSAYSLICSCHFLNRNKENLPTIFRAREKQAERPTTLTTQQVNKNMWRNVGNPLSSIENIDCEPSTSGIIERPTSSQSSGRTSSFSNTLEDLTIVSDVSSGSAQQEAELYFLTKENVDLKHKLDKRETRFSLEHIKNDESLVKMYTGIPNAHLFDILFDLLNTTNIEYYHGWTVSIIPKKDQLLMTLMKLRLNLLHTDLACRFNCSRGTVANIIYTWILALHETLFSQLMKCVPSRAQNQMCMPGCFSTFTNCRIILDCTEVKAQKPTSMEHQKSTYSHYKHMNTFKGLIGVAPNGVVTYCSELYAGSTSDKKIVEDSGIMKHMNPGDLILGDKGFLISNLLPEGVNFNIPPFLMTAQFTKEQVLCTRTIARARIHVERAIRRIKCYSILDNIPSSLASHATHIFQVCAALTNMQYPLIAEVKNLMDE